MARLTYKMPALDPHDPTGDSTWDVGLEQGQIEILLREDGKVNDKVRLYRLVLAQEVVKNPDAVFEGWQRPDQDDGLCYVGQPEIDYIRRDVEAPAPPGKVFCVYIAGSGKIVRWSWELADEVYGVEDRFRSKLWPA